MGNGADFFSRDEKGRRSEYVSLGRQVTVNGVSGRLIKRKGTSDTHTNLPFYANTSDMYFRQNAKGVCQARVYIGQKMFLDFDWSHKHSNKDGSGRTFKEGHVHVQIWKENKDGTFSRISDSARSMSPAEMKKYGPILKHFCPNIKLR
jgi:hypothetical protein